MNQSLELFCLSKNQLWSLWSKLYTVNLWEIKRFVKEPSCELGTRSTTTKQSKSHAKKVESSLPASLCSSALFGPRCRWKSSTEERRQTAGTHWHLLHLPLHQHDPQGFGHNEHLDPGNDLHLGQRHVLGRFQQGPAAWCVERVRCWVRIQAGYDLKTLLVGILDITNVVLRNAKEAKVAGCSLPTLRGWAAAPVRGLCSEDVHLPPAKWFLFIWLRYESSTLIL